MCTITYTNITGNLFIDLFIFLIIGLISIYFSLPIVYSEFKEIKQEESRIWKIISMMFIPISASVGVLAFGCLFVCISILNLIAEIACKI